MKRAFLSFIIIFFTILSAVAEGVTGDGVMRYYRMAVPVTLSAYEDDFEGDYDNVLAFWRSTETFMNSVFVPLGFCFDVLEDDCLVMGKRNMIDENYYSAPSYGTELLDEAVGASFYDIGMWVTHRPKESENTGLSVVGGAFSAGTRASGYAECDSWVVAHEVAHLLGAGHTLDGSLMDTGGDFLSLQSIKEIRAAVADKNSAYYADEARTQLVGANRGGYYVYGQKVLNSAPVFDEERMKSLYRIPRGACLSIEAFVSDAEGDRLAYATESNDFMVLAPCGNSTIDYSPRYSADIFYDDYFYIVDGTDIPSYGPGKYSLTIAVNDLPNSVDYSFPTMKKASFYSYYSLWNADVQIVAGEPFSLTIDSEKDAYSPGDAVTLRWGVNGDYFTADSQLRVMLSDDFGATFKYQLADSVPALDGECTVLLPDVKIGEKEIDFITARRTVRTGIIRLQEIGGAAYTLSCLTPEAGGGFTLDGSYVAPEPEIPEQPEPEEPQLDITTSVDVQTMSKGGAVYDIYGRAAAYSVNEMLSLPAGLYVIDAKKILIK
ncbi:MAG: hypothetical protein IKV17_06870 [Bacteroidaceae bacterium]|nr:hypothetical protein [Bacteroidaceae bacterium]